MLAQGQLISKVETIVWASPAPDVTLDELIEKLIELDMSILEVDDINNKVKVLYLVEEL